MERELQGKVAIVTGAGRMRSIGRPIAVALARAGANVVITGTGRPPERYPDDEKAAGWRDIDSVADEIRAEGAKALPLVSDIRSETAVEELVERTVAEFGRLDIVVNNAGAARGEDRRPVVDLDYDVWKNVLVTNLDGTFLLSRAAARHLIKQGEGGSIINISSASSGPPLSKVFTYGVSKAGLNNLTQWLAREWAPYKIRVNALAPGFFPAEQNRKILSPERVADILRHTPMGRMGEPEELAGTIIWLASDAASGFVTGALIRVDGGFSAMTI